METSRRDFFKLLGGTIMASSSWAQALEVEAVATHFTGAIPISQHMTNEDSAQFSIFTVGAFPYAYRVLDWQGRELRVEMWDHEKRKDYSGAIDKLIVHSLQSGGKYRLQVIDKDRGTILDERFFRNLPLKQKRSLRFAMVSCANDLFHYQNRNMWNKIFDDQPDMIFLLGDACYADIGADGSEFDLWRRHSETRRALNHFRQSNLIPTLAIWDDHDYGKNNANKNYKNKKMSQRCFQSFFGSRNVEGFKNTHGVGSVFSGFGQRFFFMDDRSFRDAPREGGMMWGEDQQDHFFEMLAQDEKPAWIFNGSQFFSQYAADESFQRDYFKNLSDVTRKLSKVEAPVVFGSGDVHFSEVMKIEPQLLGYKTYEFTSSSIHSFNPPISVLMKNPRRVAKTWKHNFMIMKSTALSGGLQTSCYATGRFGKTLFYHEGEVHR